MTLPCLLLWVLLWVLRWVLRWVPSGVLSRVETAAVAPVGWLSHQDA